MKMNIGRILRAIWRMPANRFMTPYLQNNGVSDGRKSYGRMIDLIIALNREGELLIHFPAIAESNLFMI